MTFPLPSHRLESFETLANGGNLSWIWAVNLVGSYDGNDLPSSLTPTGIIRNPSFLEVVALRPKFFNMEPRSIGFPVICRFLLSREMAKKVNTQVPALGKELHRNSKLTNSNCIRRVMSFSWIATQVCCIWTHYGAVTHFRACFKIAQDSEITYSSMLQVLDDHPRYGNFRPYYSLNNATPASLFEVLRVWGT